MIGVAYWKKTQSFWVPFDDGSKTSGSEHNLVMDLWIDENGFQHLVCPCADFQKRQWCVHVDSVMSGKNEADAKSLSASIGVPMFIKPRLVIPCLVLPGIATNPAGKPVKNKHATMARVEALWGPIHKDPDGVTADGSYSLGYIQNGGEGRATIRRLLAEWLCVIPVQYPSRMECEAAMHTRGDSVLDKGVTLNGTPSAIRKAEMLDAYQLLDSHTCRKCAEAIYIPNDPPF